MNKYIVDGRVVDIGELEDYFDHTFAEGSLEKEAILHISYVMVQHAHGQFLLQEKMAVVSAFLSALTEVVDSVKNDAKFITALVFKKDEE